MEYSVWDAEPPDHRFPRFAHSMVWLRRQRRRVMVLAVVTIVVAFLLDLFIPSYPIAGFYLLPVTLAALTLRVKAAIMVGVVCLVLGVGVMLLQHRTDGPTIVIVCFCVLSGAGLIALAYLFKHVDDLYQTERSTTLRLQTLAAQLQKLLEVTVLGSESSVAGLLGHIVEQARQLLGSDGCYLYQVGAGGTHLCLEAAAGLAPVTGDDIVLPSAGSPLAQAVRARRPVTQPGRVASDGEPSAGDGAAAGAAADVALLAVPLAVKEDTFGVLAFAYREPRRFSEIDIHLATSFCGQAALAVENARLRDEMERHAMEAERSRLARDLHDSVTQSLFAASLKAEAFRRRWEPATAEAQRHVADLERLTRGALAEMRALLMEMRPDALAEASLDDLLKHLADATEGRTLIGVSLETSGRCELRPEVSVALYRIAQEALNNVERHSRASRARVRLRCSPAGVRLLVSDDGRGFDVTDVHRERFGLRIMQERAADVGAAVEVRSRLGHGTVIAVGWSPAVAVERESGE